ncbi:hypothetical protein RRG08_058720 [Elysia crispata]|uniref:Uncharacterized protein n=1 Tax=Elysia crispata TaxID=231223 RepID=A0AAE0YWM6_9GAST|nr:hypothetical protein RRG08_058720 [Elysia crispata]
MIVVASFDVRSSQYCPLPSTEKKNERVGWDWSKMEVLYYSGYLDTHCLTSGYLDTHCLTSGYLNTHCLTSGYLDTHCLTSGYLDTHCLTSGYLDTLSYLWLSGHTLSYLWLSGHTLSYLFPASRKLAERPDRMPSPAFPQLPALVPQRVILVF